jgi:DNA-binding NarL/FixJ family response regulator
MRHFAPIGTPEMSAASRDALVLKLCRQGWTHRQIGRVVGMSPNSVGHALQRIAEGRPGRGPRFSAARYKGNY